MNADNYRNFMQCTFVCITIALLIVTSPATAAGVSTHLYIAFKAQYFFSDITKDYIEYYYAGAFFPDAFYDCFGMSDLAEAAHWPPFLKESIIYYHDTYTKHDIENKELKAFIYGMFTHQYADVPWHSLRSAQGLLKVITETDFEGDETAAHNYLDTMGDFILLDKQLQNLSDDLEKRFIDNILIKWKYPVNDIIKIYTKLGYESLTNIKLKMCMERGYSALQGEINTILTERLTRKWLGSQLMVSPFTVSIINNYYYGGIDQIVQTLSICSKELREWFNGKQILNPWNVCRPAFGDNKSFAISTGIQTPNHHWMQQEIQIWGSSERIYISTGVSNSKFGSSLCVGSFLGEETLVVSAPYDETEGSIYMIALTDLLNKAIANIKTEPWVTRIRTPKCSTTHAQNKTTFPSLFGTDLYIWKLNDLQILVVSEPGKSCFYLFIEGNMVAILNSSLSSTILGHDGYKEWKLLGKDFHDINNDGFPDLVVGSMYSDDQKFPQRGIVKVLNGKLIYERLKQFVATTGNLELLELDMNQFLLVNYTIPDNLVRNNSYEHFGSSFATTKLYSLIGISAYNIVLIFEKETGIYKDFISATEPDQENSTPFNENNLFGFNQILTGYDKDTEWVMVSAVGYSSGMSSPLCGAVYFYVIKNKTFKFKAIITPVERSKVNMYSSIYSHFGSTLLKIGHDKVVISSPGYLDGRGGLFFVNLSSLMDSSEEQGLIVVPEQLFLGDKGVGFMDLGDSSLDLAVYQEEVYVVAGLPEFQFSSVPSFLTSSGAVVLLKLDLNLLNMSTTIKA